MTPLPVDQPKVSELDATEKEEIAAMLSKIDYWMQRPATPAHIIIDDKPVEWPYRGISQALLGLKKQWFFENSPEDIPVGDFIEAKDGMRIWGTIGGAFGG